MLFFGYAFVDLFTNDENVKAVANKVIPYLAVITLIDGLQGVLGGIFIIIISIILLLLLLLLVVVVVVLLVHYYYY